MNASFQFRSAQGDVSCKMRQILVWLASSVYDPGFRKKHMKGLFKRKKATASVNQLLYNVI